MEGWKRISEEREEEKRRGRLLEVKQDVERRGV